MSGEMFPVHIEIVTRRVYLGANRYSGWPAVHYRIRTTDELFAADLRERLLHLLEQLLSNEILKQEPLTEWRSQIQAGAWPIVQLAITLQNMAGARLPASACWYCTAWTTAGGVMPCSTSCAAAPHSQHTTTVTI
jgi:hypothetical protein